MLPYKIPLNKDTFGKDELDAVTKVMASGNYTMGKQCADFETSFASYLGVKHAIMVNSGSSANLLACFAITNPIMKYEDYRLEIKRGDEIIVPALSWATTVWPILQAGLVPVFVDSDPRTLQASPRAIGDAIGPRTRGVCSVHVLGNAAWPSEVRQLCERCGLWFIEDSCEALGVKHDGEFVGSFGDIGTFSFYFAHHMTTIEGGMVVTKSDKLAELLRVMRSHGWSRPLNEEAKAKLELEYPAVSPKFMFVTSGFNVRPMELQAAIGQVQLARLALFNAQRASVTARLRGHIRTHRIVVPEATLGTEAAFFGFPILCETSKLRDQLQEYLELMGIETRPILCGNIIRQPAMLHLRRGVDYQVSGNLTGADTIMDTGFYIANHPLMTAEDINYIATTINGYLAEN